MITLYSLKEEDIDEMVAAFKTIGWNKPRNIYEKYLIEQSNKRRCVFVAKIKDKFCGYVTLKWQSSYPHFSSTNTPEIADLNVLPIYRKQGIASQLIKACEQLAKKQGYATIGLGVGLTADYGNAQRLYSRLGYSPDGKGIHYKNNLVNPGDKVLVDDDLHLYFKKSL